MNVPSGYPLEPNAVYNPVNSSSAGSSTSTKVATTLKKKINEDPVSSSSQPIVTAIIHSEPQDSLLEERTVAPANSVIALEEGPEALVDDKRSQSIFRRCFPCCIKPQN